MRKFGGLQVWLTCLCYLMTEICLRSIWQDFKYVNGTFDEELEKNNIEEIREILDS